MNSYKVRAGKVKMATGEVYIAEHLIRNSTSYDANNFIRHPKLGRCFLLVNKTAEEFKLVVGEA